jgi:hypothetical protein
MEDVIDQMSTCNKKAQKRLQHTKDAEQNGVAERKNVA